MTVDLRKKARMLAATLIQHTTSVHNCGIIQRALEEARIEGMEISADIVCKHTQITETKYMQVETRASKKIRDAARKEKENLK